MRFPIKSLLVLIVLAVALGAPVFAEQIIYFTNGDSMPILSYEIKGEMIHVDLGGNGLIAFPASRIDRIEDAGRDVLNPAGGRGNQISDRPDLESFPVTGHRRRPPERTVDDDRKIKVEADDQGVLGYRPYADSTHPGRRQLRVVGDRRIRRSFNNGPDREGPRGTTTVNGRHAIGSTGPKRGAFERPYVTTIAPNKSPGTAQGGSSAERPTQGEQSSSGKR